MIYSPFGAEVNKEIESFLSEGAQHFINGENVTSIGGQTLNTINPATGETLTWFSAGDERDANEAVKAARAAFPKWSETTPEHRARLLDNLATLIELHTEEFAMLEVLDNGKPLEHVMNADIPNTIRQFRYYSRLTTQLEGRSLNLSSGKFHSYTLKEPVGVVTQIIPWNFPLMMASWKLAPALAAGCTVILKPAEQTPLSASYLSKLINQAGFPRGVINIVQGEGPEVGAPLSLHKNVDKVAFTGSVETAKVMLKGASTNLKRVSLELGGKSPHIIFPDAPLTEAIEDVAKGIFFNQGQCCSAGSRVYIHKDIFNVIATGLVYEAQKITLGNGFSGASMGPVISSAQLERILAYLESAKISNQCKIMTGGSRVGNRGYFVNPTVIYTSNEAHPVVKEEIFGPVVTVKCFSTEEEAMELANDSCYGLAAGVWTKDVSRAHRVARKLKAGTIWVNGYNVWDPSLPFGGYKQSGWGREMGSEALDAYTETKSITIPL